MVYIYVCKRFKVTMEMISSKEADWINNLLQYFCKHTRLHAKLERAEINPKKRMSTNTYDSSADVFKLDLVYKDKNGQEHDLKWLVKVTRSDVNEHADRLLRHEKQFFSRLLTDLIDAVKQRSAGRLEGSRVSFYDILQTPEFIFEETQAQADVLRNVLVIDNLEEKTFIPLKSGGALNLWHLRVVVKTIARFHAISLLYKKVMFDVFKTHSAQVAAAKHIDDVELEGENAVPTERFGLFSRFPFLTQRQQTLTHLIVNRHQFLDMYQKLLECFPDEPHLLESFEYLRMSIDDILRLDEDIESPSYPEHPLDSIAIGIVEARSFLFSYGNPGSGSDSDKKKKSGAGVQRSQSEKSKDKETFLAQKAQIQQKKVVAAAATTTTTPQKSEPIEIPGGAKGAKCLKLEKQNSMPTNGGGGGGGGCNKARNMFLQNAKGMSKDDVLVPLTTEKKGPKETDPNSIPRTAALVNGKYVTYTRVTRDLAVTFFTCADGLIRRYYLIKMVECYSETMGITLGQLGVDTESFGVSYVNIVRDFQQHILYGFFIGVLIAMANTSAEELDRYVKKCNDGSWEATDSQKQQEASSKFVALTDERVEFLVNMMRDVNVYVESKDFELGLPITNFARYHELWSMNFGDAEEE